MQDAVYQCQCPNCVQTDEHPDRERHAQLNLLLSRSALEGSGSDSKYSLSADVTRRCSRGSGN